MCVIRWVRLVVKRCFECSVCVKKCYVSTSPFTMIWGFMVSTWESLTRWNNILTIPLKKNKNKNMSHRPVSNKLPRIHLFAAAAVVEPPPSIPGFHAIPLQACFLAMLNARPKQFSNTLFVFIGIHFQLFLHSLFCSGLRLPVRVSPLTERANGFLEPTTTLEIHSSNKTWNALRLERAGLLTVWDVIFQFLLS